MADYKTLKEPSSGEFKDRGSKFIGFALPCYAEEDAKKKIEELRKEHHKACHVCSAYKIGLDNPIVRTNDDGEPSNTGGPPILNYINKYGLDNVVIAVVRYFGGILLGKGGLINAYGSAAELAIQNGKILTLAEKITLKIDLPFDDYALVVETLKKQQSEFLKEEFDNRCHLLIRIEKDQFDFIQSRLEEFKVDLVRIAE